MAVVRYRYVLFVVFPVQIKIWFVPDLTAFLLFLFLMTNDFLKSCKKCAKNLINFLIASFLV